MWRWIVLLEIVSCGGLCIILSIYDIGFTKYKARVMWHISNGGAGICHYHFTFDIYKEVN